MTKERGTGWGRGGVGEGTSLDRMMHEMNHILNCGSQATILAVMNATLVIALRSLKNSTARVETLLKPEFFRLLYANAKTAATTARIIASLSSCL